VPVFAHRDDLPADLQSHFVNDAQDVTLGNGRVRPHYEIRPAQRVEMGRVIGAIERAVQQFSKQLGRARRIHVIHGIGGLGRGHVMRLRAYAADAVGDHGHLLDGPADRKLLEAPQLRDLEVRVAVAFEARDGIYRDSSHVSLPFHPRKRVFEYPAVALGATDCAPD
jgi:hypothetical protein